MSTSRPRYSSCSRPGYNDGRLPDGDTPAERYALRPELDAREWTAAEWTAAERIASARLGIHRAVDVRAGELILLEDLAPRVCSSHRTDISRPINRSQMA